jgi:hypothetical protein
MLRRYSDRLKTWRRSHVNRPQIGRQRRVGLPGWLEHGDCPQRRYSPPAGPPRTHSSCRFVCHWSQLLEQPAACKTSAPKSPDRYGATVLLELAGLYDQSPGFFRRDVKTAIAFDLFQDFCQQLFSPQLLLLLLLLSPSLSLSSLFVIR